MVVELMHKVKIFISYAPEDEAFREELEKHLSVHKRLKRITIRFKRQILGGADWEHEIEAQLDTAEVILLLVSADFMSSNYCYGVEMRRALDRHTTGTVRVIPIILRAVDGWEDTPLGSLDVLPTEGKPVTLWPDRDAAWKDVVRGIYEVVCGPRIYRETSPAPPCSPSPFVPLVRRVNSSLVPSKSSDDPVAGIHSPLKRISVLPNRHQFQEASPTPPFSSIPSVLSHRQDNSSLVFSESGEEPLAGVPTFLPPKIPAKLG